MEKNYTKRPIAANIESLIEKEIPILNHGFIRVVDYMGNDDSIVQAARVSYGKGTTTLNTDRALIQYLMRHRHTTPFEMCEIKLHIKAPIFIARQWLRHRTASVNEYSARYSMLDREFYIPNPMHLGTQSEQNKQCRDINNSISSEESDFILNTLKNDASRCYENYLALMNVREVENIIDSEDVVKFSSSDNIGQNFIESAANDIASNYVKDIGGSDINDVANDIKSEVAANLMSKNVDDYNINSEFVNKIKVKDSTNVSNTNIPNTNLSNVTYEKANESRYGLARELARMNLTLNYYTQWYWKIDLHNLLHFIQLRNHSHAQYEIQAYAKEMAEIVKNWVPITYDAFINYRVDSHEFSSKVMVILRKIVRNEIVNFSPEYGISKREWNDMCRSIDRGDLAV